MAEERCSQSFLKMPKALQAPVCDWAGGLHGMDGPKAKEPLLSCPGDVLQPGSAGRWDWALPSRKPWLPSPATLGVVRGVVTAVATSPQLPHSRRHSQLLCHLLWGCSFAMSYRDIQTATHPAMLLYAYISLFLFLCYLFCCICCSADPSLHPLSPNLGLHKTRPPSLAINRLNFLLLKTGFPGVERQNLQKQPAGRMAFLKGFRLHFATPPPTPLPAWWQGSASKNHKIKQKRKASPSFP